MERHHKATSNPSATVGFNRKSVKRCIWRSTNTILWLIQLIGIVVFTSCLITQLWCFWRLPQDHVAYPDGFSLSPPLPHNILNDQQRPCIECPSGQEPDPPCGSTTPSDILIQCRTCPSNTYKQGHGTSRCRPCQTCGLRQTISECTSERNTLCGECPRGYYQEDYRLDSCKSCSTCCGVKRFAELECIYLKQCKRRNCTQQMESEKRNVSKADKVSSIFATPGTITHRRRIAHRNESFKVARNLTLQNILSQLNKTRFRREISMTIQNTDTDKYATKGIDEELATPKDDNPTPPSTATLYDDGTATPQGKFQEGIDTVPDKSVLKPTVAWTPSYFGNFKALLTTLVAFVGVGVMVLIFIAVFMACKKESGQRRCPIICCVKVYLGNGEESEPLKTECDYQEFSNVGDNMVNISEKDPGAGGFESLTLSDISPDLECKLIMKLDVRHKGEYGWKTVGRAFDIEKDYLKYLEVMYQRIAGSPTKELLEILACQGRTIGDILNKLEKQNVNRPDIALLIRQHMATTKS